MTETQHQTNTEQVRHLLLSWASATRTDERIKILQSHHSDALIFDVLQPMQYAGTEAQTEGQCRQNFTVTAVAENTFSLQRCTSTTGTAVYQRMKSRRQSY